MADPRVDTFANRLRQAIDTSGLKPAEIAKRSGVAKSQITHYLKGDYESKQKNILALSKVLNVNEAWLMGYDISPQREIPPNFEPLPKTVKKPLIGQIACGDPITAEQNIEDYIDVPESVRCDFCLRCKGESMIDAGISDGDIVYIRVQPEVENGQIAAVRIGDEATLKRVYWDGKSITLIPANTLYMPKTFSGQELENIQIEGLAVGFTHWF